ncbi:hypothetical protein GQ53DRAFT_845545 [Thozetella sp. PMI_491]|nr:hypothetical protein GQ53DRAFT_845545 [Thozetella sp. PMI_491]
MTREDGNLLIAFTAFFVGLVSSRFWRIACLLLHRFYSTPHARDALHHQRQAVLRNSATPAGGAWVFGQLFWAWRGAARFVLLRTLPGFLTAVLCLTAFAAASGFSSRVSTGIGDEVLLDGNACALVDNTQLRTQADMDLVIARTAQLVDSAENYAQQCYSSNSTGMFNCDHFVVPKLPVSVDGQAPCPFQNGICRTNSSNLLLDTGYIDSHEHLGINAPTGERILFRHIYHCAPLRTDGYSSEFNGLVLNYTRYRYGSAIRGSSDNLTLQNYTFEIPSLNSQYQSQRDNFQSQFGANFRLISLPSNSFNGTVIPDQSEFIPGVDLQHPNGDSEVLFLVGNGVRFKQKMDDDWYRATVPGPQTFYGNVNGTETSYQPAEAASPMGCVQQYQYCNTMLPPESRCGPLGSYYDAALGAGPLFNLTAEQIWDNNTADSQLASQFLWFISAWPGSATLPEATVQVLGAKALISQQALRGGSQGPLPDNQWQLDIAHLWSTWLASFQASFVNTATGPRDTALTRFLRTPGDAYQQVMCNSQKIRSTDYTSVSIFGLGFVFVTGAVIIILSYIMEPLFECLERRQKHLSPKDIEWRANETFSLQQLAFHGLGRGLWMHGNLAVPRTQDRETFNSLAIVKDPRSSNEESQENVKLSS